MVLTRADGKFNKFKLQDSDKFNLTHTKFFNYRGAIHTIIFKNISSLLVDKPLNIRYF